MAKKKYIYIYSCSQERGLRVIVYFNEEKLYPVGHIGKNKRFNIPIHKYTNFRNEIQIYLKTTIKIKYIKFKIKRQLQRCFT